MQSRYAQIEKELLAVVYDLERFHTYTYGKRSVCGIRPQASGSYLQGATASNSEEASAHAHASPVVQRQPWLQEGLHHVSGRHPKSGLLTLRWKPGCRFKDWEHQHDATHIRLKPSTLQEIPDHTQKDNSLLELIKVIKAGWPETKGELSHVVLPFFDVRDELSVCDGIVIRGETVTLRFYHRDWIEK